MNGVIDRLAAAPTLLPKGQGMTAGPRSGEVMGSPRLNRGWAEPLMRHRQAPHKSGRSTPRCHVIGTGSARQTRHGYDIARLRPRLLFVQLGS
jgi:hypothetical protein